MKMQKFVLLGLLAVLSACSGNSAGPDANAGKTSLDAAGNAPASSASPATTVPVSRNPDGQTANASPAPVSGEVTSAGAGNNTPSSAAECTQRGGTWRKAGLMKLDVCDLPMADAGKPCQSDSECESVCVAAEGAGASGPVTGMCYRSNITVGTCLSLVEGGRITQAQCAD